MQKPADPDTHNGQTVCKELGVPKFLDVARLWMRPLQPVHDLVAGIDVGLGRSNHDVSICTLPIDDTPTLLETHRDLALRIGALGDVVH